MMPGKGMAVLIAEKMRKGDGGGGEGRSDEAHDAGMADGLTDAMSALSSALKAGDSKAAAEAFRNAVDICG